MCLIAFAYRPDAPHWLQLVANRDEFHARPSAALDDWPDEPRILGGRDLEAGGSWLALHRRGRLATVTNVRDPALVVPKRAPSRGELVRQALNCDDLEAWLEHLAAGEAWRYAGFNLLVADEAHRLWHLHRSRHALTLQRVAPGLHGLSNADLDTPWPKLLATRRGLGDSLAHGDWPHGALAAMGDDREFDDARLPDTGIGRELERRLSAAFIRGDTYGTRATTWLRWHRDGGVEITERRFAPEGRQEGETHRTLQLPSGQDISARVPKA